MTIDPQGRLAARLRRIASSRAWVYAFYVGVALYVTVRRGAPESTHTTFKIYRQSFWHLFHNTNLYAHYPAEQGAAAVDLFKYSPTAAALFAPFAVLPAWPAMLLWSLVNAFGLCFALERLLGAERARVAQWLLLPEALATMQAMQSNAIITALIIAGFVAMEGREQLRAAAAILTAAALKIYPAAALMFGVCHPRRLRFFAISALTGLLGVLLPLLFTTPAMLVQQYRWWFATEARDAADLQFGSSIMQAVRGWLHVSWPNWPMQIIGTVVLLAPLLVRREGWRDAEFRIRLLASLLAYAVLFNHQAERGSFIIGVTGVVIWYVVSPRGAVRRWLMLLPVLGLQTVPLLAAWLAMQHDLWRAPLPGEAGLARAAR